MHFGVLEFFGDRLECFNGRKSCGDHRGEFPPEDGEFSCCDTANEKPIPKILLRRLRRSLGTRIQLLELDDRKTLISQLTQETLT